MSAFCIRFSGCSQRTEAHGRACTPHTHCSDTLSQVWTPITCQSRIVVSIQLRAHCVVPSLAEVCTFGSAVQLLVE